MLYVVSASVAFFASALTLFSGFGLGTILTPAFALFFPIHVAVAATAIVHLANNLFKLVLIGRRADFSIVLRFGAPAALAAFVGAGVLTLLAGAPPLVRYELFGAPRDVDSIGLVIGLLIAGFAALELTSVFARLAIPRRYLPVGGLISGFFGGLSGNQGALRAAFLIKSGLDKQAFVATGVVCAVIVDVSRLFVYGASFFASGFSAMGGDVWRAVALSAVAAFLGAFLGVRVLEKVTLGFVRRAVATMMIVIGAGLALGVI